MGTRDARARGHSRGAAGSTRAIALGDLGAEAVEVEPPVGEWGRGLEPPFADGVATASPAANRNTRPRDRLPARHRRSPGRRSRGGCLKEERRRWSSRSCGPPMARSASRR
ncbi:MAG: CoA transferase [Thermoleophilia bacterium]|nr:CoA transferase [Thermoleophilia bacterium]